MDSFKPLVGYGYNDGFLLKLSESKAPMAFAKFGSGINDRLYYAGLSSDNNSIRLFGSSDHYLKYRNKEIFNESESAFVLDFPLQQECDLITDLKSNDKFTNGQTILVKENKIELKSDLFLNSKEITLSLFDIQGRLIKSTIEYPQSETVTFETDLNFSGLYFLQIIRDKENHETVKIIME